MYFFAIIKSNKNAIISIAMFALLGMSISFSYHFFCNSNFISKLECITSDIEISDITVVESKPLLLISKEEYDSKIASFVSDLSDRYTILTPLDLKENKFVIPVLKAIVIIDFDNKSSSITDWVGNFTRNQQQVGLVLVATNNKSAAWKNHVRLGSQVGSVFRYILASNCNSTFSSSCQSSLAQLIQGELFFSTELPTGNTFRDRMIMGSLAPEMVVIPIGSFLMGGEQGAPDAKDEFPKHSVDISHPIAVSKTEVTVADFRHFILDTGYSIDKGCWYHTEEQDWVEDSSADWQYPVYKQDDTYPVTCINWEDAVSYVRWLSNQTGYNYRLPSEAEFEFFNRSGFDGNYGFELTELKELCKLVNGSDISTNMPYANQCEDGFSDAAPVAQFSANQFGLYDTSGNLWEFTQDCWNDSYSGNWRTLFMSAPNDGSVWRSGSCGLHVIRGGSFLSSTKNLQVSRRERGGGVSRLNRNGIRLVRDL